MSESQLPPDSFSLAASIASKLGLDPSIEGRAPLECDVCHGGYTVDEAPLGLVGTMCEPHAAATIRSVAARTLRPIIPADLHHAQPDHLLPELRNWNPTLGGVYLFGPVGTGKSHQAAALVKASWAYLRREHGGMPRVAWRNVSIMMDDIAATFATRQAYDMGSVRDATVLVLDDMGLADNMPFAVRKLYTLLEHRLHNRLCTIVTSNRDVNELGKHLDSPQIASRITQMCAQVSFEKMEDRRIDLAPRLE